MVAGPVTTELTAGTRRLPYMPGIDGLRAIAVVSVMFYHSNPDTMLGGFLGVEVFFVISGYLITSGSGSDAPGGCCQPCSSCSAS